LNARSLRNKLSVVETLLATLGFIQVIVIVETWLTQEQEKYFNFHNYDAIHVSRKGKRGGGLSVFVHISLSYKELNRVNRDHSIVKLKIGKAQTDFILVAVYNPSISNAEHFF